jgi:hypothetical protein
MRRWLRRFTPLMLVLFAIPTGLGAQSYLLQSANAARELQLHSDPHHAWVELADGDRVELPLRAGDRFSAVVALGGTWLVAGTRQVGGKRRLRLLQGGPDLPPPRHGSSRSRCP